MKKLYQTGAKNLSKNYHFVFMAAKKSIQVIEPGTQIRDYIFNECIGSGGYAAVYLVTSLKFNSKFVAKVILPRSRDVSHAWESFDSEVSSLVKLDNPHIIRLYDHFTENGLFYLILEYCSHGSLFDEVKECGPLKGQRLITVSKQLISAVYTAHKFNIAHRDIKPHNILFDDFGRVKLADFGIAMSSDEAEFPQNFKCSPAFGAPEVLRKEPHDIFKADLWSLGVTLYFASTGQLPFQFRTVTQILQDMKQSGINISKKIIPPCLFEIFKHLIVYDPNKRIPIEEVNKMIHSFHQEKINKAVSFATKFPSLKLTSGIQDTGKQAKQISPQSSLGADRKINSHNPANCLSRPSSPPKKQIINSNGYQLGFQVNPQGSPSSSESHKTPFLASQTRSCVILPTESPNESSNESSPASPLSPNSNHMSHLSIRKSPSGCSDRFNELKSEIGSQKFLGNEPIILDRPMSFFLMKRKFSVPDRVRIIQSPQILKTNF
ncbi:hypothetical protein TRFO_37306 [Tritrichomonas foetus]|uniref:Protein kinase domain-containing protein n=1 Tax=Tritrichomonas foetus TaxID=1144522 RepID=A0A1J4JFS4_9EUKA|nr:hypothetical protein TRFO_37306 [Tritrichomonas foetus]|eukprot:OHS96491.1 hypothetical protein TRFO_37306 [Tritrichomonas foetus]